MQSCTCGDVQVNTRIPTLVHHVELAVISYKVQWIVDGNRSPASSMTRALREARETQIDGVKRLS